MIRPVTDQRTRGSQQQGDRQHESYPYRRLTQLDDGDERWLRGRTHPRTNIYMRARNLFVLCILERGGVDTSHELAVQQYVNARGVAVGRQDTHRQRQSSVAAQCGAVEGDAPC